MVFDRIGQYAPVAQILRFVRDPFTGLTPLSPRLPHKITEDWRAVAGTWFQDSPWCLAGFRSWHRYCGRSAPQVIEAGEQLLRLGREGLGGPLKILE